MITPYLLGAWNSIRSYQLPNAPTADEEDRRKRCYMKGVDAKQLGNSIDGAHLPLGVWAVISYRANQATRELPLVLRKPLQPHVASDHQGPMK